MEQTKALNALEPYLALTKSAAAPRAAADLVTQATSNPNTYVFAELLQTPQIQSLSQSSEYAPYLTLLEIFSYGTFSGYTAAAPVQNLPPLNDAQALKLRQLSLLTLARDPRNLSYASLQQQLSLPDARSVEDLVISAIYAGLMEAQLDPRHQAVLVSSVSPLRDLEPGSVPAMLTALRTWSGRCNDTLADLRSQIAILKSDARKRAAEDRVWADTQARLMAEERKAEGAHGARSQQNIMDAVARFRAGGRPNQRSVKRGSGSLDASVDEDEAMDVDEEEPDDGGEMSNGMGSGSGGKKQRASRRKL
ncbi:hypothetical protein GGS26DRAFT_190956 [Hypomontagnella submonticulosa]|nr:hypothetical protein GGS26DRAFT_190956 [Hypomontagnella submonticulosa]